MLTEKIWKEMQSFMQMGFSFEISTPKINSDYYLRVRSQYYSKLSGKIYTVDRLFYDENNFKFEWEVLKKVIAENIATGKWEK